MTEVQSFLTPEKFKELKQELEHLKTVRRKEIAEALEYARSLGDLSENAEYQEARDMQAAIEERITYLEKTIKEAKIIDEKKKGDVVGLGSVVSIQKDKEKDKKEYKIVGSDEANIHDRKLSYLSPLGDALMGKSKGDEFEFETPIGPQKYKVLKVE
jgi:transcription elongation factor GreA